MTEKDTKDGENKGGRLVGERVTADTALLVYFSISSYKHTVKIQRLELK